MESVISIATLRPLELLINRGIGVSSTAQAMAAALEGRTLDLVIDGTPFRIRLAAREGQVDLTFPDDTPAAATLKGPPLAMLRMLGSDPQAPIRAGDVSITGSTDVADRFRDLLTIARPDLEEELSKLTGDAVAHEIGNVARGLVGFGMRTATSVSRSIGEYLTEERRTLPTRAEVDEFHAAVDRVANDVERAEARLAQLRAHIGDGRA